jgi:hypothetical protein
VAAGRIGHPAMHCGIRQCLGTGVARASVTPYSYSIPLIQTLKSFDDMGAPIFLIWIHSLALHPYTCKCNTIKNINTCGSCQKCVGVCCGAWADLLDALTSYSGVHTCPCPPTCISQVSGHITGPTHPNTAISACLNRPICLRRSSQRAARSRRMPRPFQSAPHPRPHYVWPPGAPQASPTRPPQAVQRPWMTHRGLRHH